MNSVVSERSKNEVFGGQGKSPGAALTPRRFFFFFWVGSGRALNPHPHTRFFRGFFAVQKFFDYTISLRKSENPILYSKGSSDSFWTHM